MYCCIKDKYLIENTIKKSRFIGVVMPCNDEKDVHTDLKYLAAQYADASHIAFAYRLKTDNGLVYRFHDAGEPTGTAGKPIFQHIEGKNLINLLVAVIRYFGGVKLGAGGLVRAYGNAAREVIEAAEILPFIQVENVQLTLDYHQLQPLAFLLKKLDGVIVKQEFAGQIQVVIQLPTKNTETLLQTFSGSNFSY